METRTFRSDGCLSHLVVSGHEAAFIDPARDTAKYLKALAEGGHRLRWVIDTHTHADHLSGARKLADETGARLVMSAHHAEQWRAAEGQADALGIGDVLRANAGVKVDESVADGATLELGQEGLAFLEAPGHTRDSLVVLAGPRAFTGDTLLIGQTGRCDLPGGDAGDLYDTLFGRLAKLPDETFLYPGHDYQGQTVSALGFERAGNRFLARRSREEFATFLAGAFPTLTGSGMQCGATAAGCDAGGKSIDPLLAEVAGFMDARFFGGKAAEDHVTAGELDAELAAGRRLVLLDVREPEEYEAGHLPGAVNVSVHQLDRRLAEVPAGRDDEVVAICRSGKRSGWAAMFLRVAGFRRVRSLAGGMLAWQRCGLKARTGREP